MFDIGIFKTKEVQEFISKIADALSEIEPIIQADSTQNKRLNSDKIAKTPFKRLHKSQPKLKNSIRTLQNRERKKLYAKIQTIPVINERSKVLIGKTEALHTRIDKIIQNKSEKILKLSEKISKERDFVEGKELTFRPKILTKQTNRPDFYEYSQEWKEKRDSLIHQKRLNIENHEKPSFSPQIDLKSARIAHDSTPLQIRLIEWKKTKDEINQYKREYLPFFFTPNILQRSRNLTRNYSEDVFSRLCKSSNKTINSNIKSK